MASSSPSGHGGGSASPTSDDDHLIDMPDMSHSSPPSGGAVSAVIHGGTAPGAVAGASVSRRRSITFEERRWLDDHHDAAAAAGQGQQQGTQHPSPPPSGGGHDGSRQDSGSSAFSFHSAAEGLMRRLSSAGSGGGGGRGSSFHAANNLGGSSGGFSGDRQDDDDPYSDHHEEEDGDDMAPLPRNSIRGSMDMMEGWNLTPPGHHKPNNLGGNATAGDASMMFGESMVGSLSMGFAALGVTANRGGGGGNCNNNNSMMQDSMMIGAGDACGPAAFDEGEYSVSNVGAVGGRRASRGRRGSRRYSGFDDSGEEDDRALSSRIGAGIMITNEDKAAAELDSSNGCGGKKKKKKGRDWRPRSKIFRRGGRGDEVPVTVEEGVGSVTSGGGGRRRSSAASVSKFADDLVGSLAYDTGVSSRQRRVTLAAPAWTRQESEEDLAMIINGRDLQLEAALASAIKDRAKGWSLCSALALIASIGLQLMLVPFFFFSPTNDRAAPSSPSWHAVTAAGVPLLEGLSQILLLLFAVYLTVQRGSLLAAYLLRHASYYLTLVGLSYVIADGAYFHRYGDSTSMDGADAERGARLGLAAVILACALASLVSSERGAIGTIRKLARSELNRVVSSSSSDDSSDPTKEGAKDPTSNSDVYDAGTTLKRRRAFHLVATKSIAGYQLLAFLFALRTTADYLFRHLDEGAWASEYLGAVASTGGGGGAAAYASSEGHDETGGGGGAHHLLPALLQSTSSFLHLAFLLSVSSCASLLPHSADAVNLAFLASVGRLLLSVGYAVNLATVVGGANNVDGFWSAGLTAAEMGCSLGMVYACAFLSDGAGNNRRGLWKRKNAARVAVDDVDGGGASAISIGSPTRQGRAADDDNLTKPGTTLRSVAYSSFHRPQPRLYSAATRFRAKTLHLSSAVVLVVHTAQSLLLLGHSSSSARHRDDGGASSPASGDYDSQPAVDAIAFGMHLCFLYSLINHLGLWEGGAHYRRFVRPAAVVVGLAGMGLCGWQLGMLVAALADANNGGDRAMGALDATSVVLPALALPSYLTMACSAWSLKDLGVAAADDDDDDNPHGANSSSSSSSAAPPPSQQTIPANNSSGSSLKVRRIRRAARRVLQHVYLPTVLAYALCVAIYEGRDGTNAASSDYNYDNAATMGGGLNYPLVNRAQELPPGLMGTFAVGEYAYNNRPPPQGDDDDGVGGRRRRRLSWVYYDENDQQAQQIQQQQQVHQDVAVHYQQLHAGATTFPLSAPGGQAYQTSDGTTTIPRRAGRPDGPSPGGRHRVLAAASLLSQVDAPTGFFLLAINRPGLKAFFYSGLIFAAIATGGLRKRRPTMAGGETSLHMGTLSAVQGCVVLLGYLVSRGMFIPNREGEEEGSGGYVKNASTTAEFILTVMWCAALTALVGLFVRLRPSSQKRVATSTTARRASAEATDANASEWAGGGRIVQV